MNGPKRVQRTRTKGGGMPPGAVYVGRPGRWGNGFPVGKPLLGEPPLSAAEAVEKYRVWVIFQIRAGVLDLDELVGHDLACWCALDKPCHADVLIDLASASARRLGKRVRGARKP